jgi:hypothetical protein
MYYIKLKYFFNIYLELFDIKGNMDDNEVEIINQFDDDTDNRFIQLDEDILFSDPNMYDDQKQNVIRAWVNSNGACIVFNTPDEVKEWCREKYASDPSITIKVCSNILGYSNSVSRQVDRECRFDCWMDRTMTRYVWPTDTDILATTSMYESLFPQYMFGRPPRL